MTITGNLAAETRLTWLRRRLEEEGHLSIADAATDLGVSEMTIRRDLREIEALGLARRVRGGAMAVGPQPFEERHARNAKAKARIAAKLVNLVPNAGAIGLDASSTLLRLASSIDAARELTVLTNGPQTFEALQDKPGLTPLLTGGQLDPRTGSLVGPLACRPASDLLLDRLFVSAAAVHPELGASEACLEEAEVKRALCSVSADVVLAVDSSKLGGRSVAIGLDWDRISTLVTELDPSDPRLEPYRKLVGLL